MVSKFSTVMVAARRQSRWKYNFWSRLWYPDKLSVKSKGRVMMLRTNWSMGSSFFFITKCRIPSVGHRKSSVDPRKVPA